MKDYIMKYYSSHFDLEQNKYIKKNNLMFLLYYYSTKEDIKLSGPLMVGIEITKKCNLRCIHCFKDNYDMEDQLKLSDVDMISKQMQDIGVLDVYLTGGEPFLRRDIEEVIKIIKSYKLPLSIHTNATLINSYIAKYLSKVLNMTSDYLQVSLDGSLPKIHNCIRGTSDAYDNAMLGIKYLIEYKIPVKVNMTITNINCYDMLSMYKLCEKIGVKYINYNAYFDIGQTKMLKIPDKYVTIKNYVEVYEYYQKKGILYYCRIQF